MAAATARLDWWSADVDEVLKQEFAGKHGLDVPGAIAIAKEVDQGLGNGLFL